MHGLLVVLINVILPFKKV